jgi:hypothetical protein
MGMERPSINTFLVGVCDIFKENNEVRCRHSLAPSQKLLSILEACLRDNLSRQYQSEDKDSGDALGSLEDRVNNVLSTWSHALANLDPHRLAKHEGHATRIVRACAVFIIIVLLMDFWAAWSVIVKEDNEIAALKLIFSTICCLAAGVCIAAVFDTTMLRVAGQHEGYIGAAVATPFAGMVFRFFYYQIMESCPKWCGLRQKPNQFAGKTRVHSRTTTTTGVAMSPITAPPELEAGDVNQPPAATTPRRTSQDSKPEVDNIGTIDAPRGYIPRDGLVAATNNSQV